MWAWRRACQSSFPASTTTGRSFLVIATPLFFGVAGLAVETRLRVRSRRTTSVRSISMPDASGPALVIPYSLALAVIYWVIVVTTIFLFLIIALVAVVGLASSGLRDAVLFVPALVSMAFVVYLLVYRSAAQTCRARGVDPVAAGGLLSILVLRETSCPGTVQYR